MAYPRTMDYRTVSGENATAIVREAALPTDVAPSAMLESAVNALAEQGWTVHSVGFDSHGLPVSYVMERKIPGAGVSRRG